MPESNSLEWMLYIHKIRLSLIGIWIQNQNIKLHLYLIAKNNCNKKYGRHNYIYFRSLNHVDWGVATKTMLKRLIIALL